MPDYRHARERPHPAARQNFAAVVSDRESPPDKVLRDRLVPESFEEADSFLKDVDHLIDFLAVTIKIKTRSRASSDPEAAHERLIAMMSTAHRESVAIGKRGQIVRMRRVHDETDYAGAILLWPDYAQSWHFSHSVQCVDRKIDIVRKDFGTSDSFEIIDCGGQSNCAGNVGSARFETMRRFFIGTFFERHARDHFATAVPRRRRIEKLRPTIEHAAAGRRAQC